MTQLTVDSLSIDIKHLDTRLSQPWSSHLRASTVVYLYPLIYIWVYSQGYLHLGLFLYTLAFMSQRQKQCKFFSSPTGCRNGDRCKLAHTADTTSLPTSSSPQTRTQIHRPSRRPENPLADVPRNICQFFWATGACARGFECVYHHVKRANETSVLDQAAEVTAAGDGDVTNDFFSPEGLAIGTGSLREDRFNLNPSEVHNHLKGFLGDTYHFDTAAQAQGFVRILASVNDRNKSWVRIKFQRKVGDLIFIQRIRKMRKSF